jgi:hypothetical protein
MSAEPGTTAANGGAVGDDGGDETEPLPGDVHYPWLERKMQTAYTQLVSDHNMQVQNPIVSRRGWCCAKAFASTRV